MINQSQLKRHDHPPGSRCFLALGLDRLFLLKLFNRKGKKISSRKKIF